MRALWIVLLTCSCALAQGSLSVYNAATGGGVIAPGSLIEVDYGRVFDPATSAPQPTGISFQSQSLNRIFVGQLLNPPGTGPLSYATSGSVLAVVPDALPPGQATITLEFKDTSALSTSVTVAAVSVGIFAAERNLPGLASFLLGTISYPAAGPSAQGYGPAIAQNDAVASQPSPNQLTNPALPGQYVTLWATGLGALTTPDVTVNISGIAVPASFAGPAPGQPGVDQINFQLPENLVTGCYTPLTVTAGSGVSNAVTISTSKGGPCTHPLGLSVGQMKALVDGSGVMLGTVSFTGFVDPPASKPSELSRYESISASFEVTDAYSVFLESQTASGEPSCSLGWLAVPTSGFRLLDPMQPPPAGPSLTATGPSGNRYSLTPYASGSYSTHFSEPATAATPDQLPPPVLSSGPWEITVPGGPVIGAFQQSYSLPPQIRIANRESLATINRSADVPVTWNPQGYSSDAVVTASLSSGFTTLSCTAPANEGQLTMPASLRSFSEWQRTPGVWHSLFSPRTRPSSASL